MISDTKYIIFSEILIFLYTCFSFVMLRKYITHISKYMLLFVMILFVGKIVLDIDSLYYVNNQPIIYQISDKPFFIGEYMIKDYGFDDRQCYLNESLNINHSNGYLVLHQDYYNQSVIQYISTRIMNFISYIISLVW